MIALYSSRVEGIQMRISAQTASLVVLAIYGYIETASIAKAQNWYYVNGHPAPYGVARKMADSGAPYGYYWLHSNGNWGAIGTGVVAGNIREGQTLSSLDEADDVEPAK